MNDLPARILVVDDEEPHLEFITEVLHGAGYTTVAARDGLEALDKFEKYQPDLVVIDLMLPRLNGLEVSSRLRHHPHGQTVPILMMTGLLEPEVKIQALQGGIDDLLTKPIAPIELEHRVRALLKLRFCNECEARQQAAVGRLHRGLADVEQLLATLAALPSLQAEPGARDQLAAAREICGQLGRKG
ncbi:response regulator [bacterium]|nr:response regulator [bacterium]